MKTLFAILLMIIGLLVHKLEGIFTKKYNVKNNKGGFIFTSIVSLFSMIFFFANDLIMDPNGLQFGMPVVVYGIIGGVFFAAACITMYYALEWGSFGLTNLLASFGILITIIHGLFLGETITWLSWVGIALIAVSIFLVKGGEKEKIKFTAKWLIMTLCAIFTSGLYGILQRQQQVEFNSSLNNEFMIVVLAVSAICLFIIGVIKDGKDLKDIFKHGFLYAAGGGISNGLTNFLTLYVYTLVPISFAAPMKTGLTILLSFVIARLIFKEKYSKRQYLGVALGTIALVLENWQVRHNDGAERNAGVWV